MKTLKKSISLAFTLVMLTGTAAFSQNTEIAEAYVKDYSVNKSETKISITGIQQENGFLKWKKSISLSKPKIKNENNDYIKIIHKIREFEIVNNTPVEAFNFLAEIQKQLLEL